MTTQESLFGTFTGTNAYGHPLLARSTDPPTAKAAARDIAPSLGKLHEWAEACVRESPGLTQRELGARWCAEDLRKIGRRLPELVRAGRVRLGDARRCSVTGKRAGTYWPI